jgi:hypothetical protein
MPRAAPPTACSADSRESDSLPWMLALFVVCARALPSWTRTSGESNRVDSARVETTIRSTDSGAGPSVIAKASVSESSLLDAAGDVAPQDVVLVHDPDPRPLAHDRDLRRMAVDKRGAGRDSPGAYGRSWEQSPTGDTGPSSASDPHHDCSVVRRAPGAGARVRPPRAREALATANRVQQRSTREATA